MRSLIVLKLWVRDVLSAAWWLVRRFLGKPVPEGVRILVYHAIAELPPEQDRWRMAVPPKLLTAQLRWLQRQGYTFVSLDEVLEMVRGLRAVPEKAVAVTFDDGFQDTWSSAYPILQKAGVPATAFIVPSYVETQRPFPWLEHPDRFNRPLTWEELRRFSGDRLMTVGAHGWTHRCLSELATEDQSHEVQQSKVVLEEGLGRPVKWFAYPYGFRGSFSETTVACLRQHGYEAACANVMGINRQGDSLWELKRTRIGWEDSLWRFRLKMAGAYDWIDQWPARRIRP